MPPRSVGRYEIVRELGRGGMAVVHLARQLDLDRLVALKELRALDLDDSSMARRFSREARLAGILSHPNIVTVHDYFEYDATPYIAMELVEGGSLRPYVGRLSFAQIAGVLESLLLGLGHAHGHGIVHRDLKPENLLLTADGGLKIADFGIAQAVGEFRSGTVLTATGRTVGTPTYMAPEQAMGGAVGPWTDLYAVGCIAYELCVGETPFDGSDAPMALMLRHMNELAVPARSRDRAVDQDVSDWIDRLLAKAPDERPGSASEACDQLGEIVDARLGPRWRRSAGPGLTAPATPAVGAVAGPPIDGPVEARSSPATPPTRSSVPAESQHPSVPPHRPDARTGRWSRRGPVLVAVCLAAAAALAVIAVFGPGADDRTPAAATTSVGFGKTIAGLCDRINADEEVVRTVDRRLQRRLRSAHTTAARRTALFDAAAWSESRSGDELSTLTAADPPRRLAGVYQRTVAAWTRGLERLRDYAQAVRLADSQKALRVAVAAFAWRHKAVSRDAVEVRGGLRRLGAPGCRLVPPRPRQSFLLGPSDGKGPSVSASKPAPPGGGSGPSDGAAPNAGTPKAAPSGGGSGLPDGAAPNVGPPPPASPRGADASRPDRKAPSAKPAPSVTTPRPSGDGTAGGEE